MTDIAQEWREPVFTIELPVGGFVEPIQGNTIYQYRDTDDPQIQEALYAVTPPAGYTIETNEQGQWRHVATSL